jgi:hypothetical protein
VDSRASPCESAKVATRWDIEWIALTAGIKPALRLNGGENAASMIARYEHLGAAVVVAQGYVRRRGKPQTLLYVAMDRARAEAVRDAEAPVVVDGGPRQVEACRRTGELLGYPPCCVDAFCLQYEREHVLWPEAHADYVGARTAYTPRPLASLNTLMRSAGVQIVSFEPCRFHCPRASAYADDCLAALGRVDRAAPPALLARLSRPMAIAPDGARAIVVLDDEPVLRITGASVLERHDGGPADARDEALARRLAGGAPVVDGRVATGERRPPIVLDFRAARPVGLPD